MEAAATRNAILRGNLDSQADPWDPVAQTGGRFSGLLQVYDSLGLLHKLPITFEKLDPTAPVNPNDPSLGQIGDRAWYWKVTDPLAGPDPVGEGYLIFTQNGKFDPVATESKCSAAGFQYPPQFNVPITDGSAPQTVNLDLESLTQYAEPSSVSMSFQDGFPAGTLETFAVDADGIITGIYSNGQYRTLAQIVLANFANPGGLLRMGGGFYQVSPNSGAPIIGEPMKDGKGKIIGGAIEMSNVDLAKQFTDMIISQRGFQANSRVITTADEMLQDLLSLKR